MFQIWSWYEKNWGSCEILFMASYHKQPPGASKLFLMHYCVTNVYISVNITPNMESWESDLSDDMYFVKIINVLNLKDRNALCNMTLDSAH